MAGFTKAAQRLILDNATVGLERNLWVALFKFTTSGSYVIPAGQEPYDDGTLPPCLTEVSGGGYARQPVTAATWDPASTGDAAAKTGFVGPYTGGVPTTKDINAVVAFTAAGAPFGNLVAWGLYDALTAGVLIASGPITNSSGSPIAVAVADGETFQFDAANPLRMQMGDLSGDAFA